MHVPSHHLSPPCNIVENDIADKGYGGRRMERVNKCALHLISEVYVAMTAVYPLRTRRLN